MPCPCCATELQFVDTLRGRVINCPDCGESLRVVPPAHQETLEVEEAPRDTGIQEAPEEPPQPFGIDPKKLKPRRFRKKKKRKSAASSFLAEQWFYVTGALGPFGYVLMGMVACWLLTLLLTPLLPRLSLLLILGGSVLYPIGWWWIVLIAYRDDGISGTLCLLTGLYTYVYVWMNVEATWKPAGLLLLSLLMQASGLGLAFYFGVKT